MNPTRRRTTTYVRSIYPQPTRSAPKRPRIRHKKVLLLLAVLALVLVVYLLAVKYPSFGRSLKIGGSSPGAGLDKQLHTTNDPSSVWVVVNKKLPLNPLNYAPGDLVTPHAALRSNITDDESKLRSGASQAFEKLANIAGSQGLNLNLQSGFRSYELQATLYDSYIKQQGQATADRQSARAGYSEHQTGLAADVGSVTKPDCNLEACFANTNEGQWLAANAYKYGFVVRYPADKEAITGYMYEPWHLRYVGTELSVEMHDQGVTTLEEFFGLGAAPNY